MLDKGACLGVGEAFNEGTEQAGVGYDGGVVIVRVAVDETEDCVARGFAHALAGLAHDFVKCF